MDALGIKLKSELEDFCSIEPKLKPYGSLKQIESLDNATKERILKQLALHRKIRESMGGLGYEDPEVTKKGLRMCLHEFGLKMAADITPYIKFGDIVEMYDSNFVQFHHNLVFYKYCSYELIDVFVRPMHELYSRPQEITDKIVSEALNILNDPFGVKKIHVPQHRISEIYGDRRRMFNIQLKFGTAVFDKNDRAVGFISTNTCTEATFHAV